jgi:subtilase family serine protease
LRIRSVAAIALACALAGCAASHVALTPDGANAAGLPPGGAEPSSRISALPGSTLPCGFPAHARAHPNRHNASCPVAVNVHFPGIRNPHFPAAKIPGLHPSDIVSAYGFPYNAAGFTVGIVDAYDDPRAEADLDTYRSEFGLPPCTSSSGCFRKVNQQGQTGRYPHASRAWSQEIALDVEMVSAVCPQCPILLVEANSASIADLAASVDEAVALGARAVSNSYYALEWKGESAEDVHYDHPGVAITVASGDRAKPYYPAASPYVTAVGATTLTNASGTISQTPWKYSGQGCSSYEPRPSFQPALCSTRSPVDMAVVGDPQTGVAMFSTQSGGWVVAGGTSVGAPVIAAAYALSGNPQGPAFSYANPGAFAPVPAGAGFTLASGLGSPVGVSGL